MKRLLASLLPVAIAAVALVSCQKEIEPQGASNAPGTLNITVHASVADLGDSGATKTYIVEYQGQANTILWGTGEYMKIGVFDGTATTFGDSADGSADANNGKPTATFNFSITPANNSGDYTYYGLYPAGAAVASTNTNPANYKVNLPASQSATESSYDPKAYIMIAQSESGKTAAAATWEAKFRRATALNKVTLKNLPSGVSIRRVTITAPSGVYLAGGRHFNLTTGESGDIYSGGGRTETIEVKYNTPLAGSGEGTWNADIWFTSWGATVEIGDELQVVAYTTNQKSYTRTIEIGSNTPDNKKPLTFKEGYLNTLSVSMSGITPEDVTELEEGDYLILAKNGTNYYALKAQAEGTSSRMDFESYTGSTSSFTGAANLVWTVSKSNGSYIIENDSKYLGWSGGSSNTAELKAAAEGTWTATNYLMDIVYDSDNSCFNVKVNANNNRILAKNTGDYGFAFYTGTGYNSIIFVPATVDTRDDVTLSFDEDVINLTTANYDSFLGQDVAASPDVTAITEHLVWSKVDNDSVIDDFDKGVLTLTGNEGSATVTVAFGGDTNYKPASASYTINVTSSSSITLTSSDIDEGSNVAAITVNSLLGYRLGTSKNAGDITIKANNYATISFKAVAWKSSSDSFSITNGTISSASSYSPSANDAATGTINAGASVPIYSPISEVTIDVTDSSSDVVITSNKRVILWDFTATAAGPAVTWNLESISITTAPGKTTYTEGESFDPTGMVVTGHFVDADDNTNTKDEAVTGYTISPDGALSTSDDHVTITYQDKTVNQNITVNAAPAPTYDFETVAELNARVTSTSASYNGYLTNAIVSFAPTTGTAFIKDATGSVMVYKTSHGLSQGQTYTGAITVTAIKYNSLYSEITAWSGATFTGDPAVVAPVNVSLADLSSHYDDYQNAYVSVAGLTVTSISSKNINVTDGTNDYVVYYNPGTPTCGVDDVITAVGTITKYQSTEEIKVWAAADITVTGSAPKAITFNQPASGGSFTVSVSGSPITSGTTVASGTTVTLTANAATDYTFNGWTVSGATVTDASAATTTFEMGTSAVTVSASFSSNNSTGPAIGTVMWSETWQGGDARETPANYGQEGTTVYNGGSVTYTNGGTATMLYDDTMSTTNLLLARSANSGTWTISGIPTGGVSSLTLSFETNNSTKARYAISTTTSGVSLGDLSVSGSANPYTVTATITITGTVNTFNLTFTNGSSSNVRLDNISVVTASN